MRNITDILIKGESVQSNLQDSLHDMVGAQLPKVMDEVVKRNTQSAVSEMGEASVQSARQLQETVKREVVSEVMTLLDAATEQVVGQVAQMLEETLPV